LDAPPEAVRDSPVQDENADSERAYFDDLVEATGESWWGHCTPAGKRRLARRGEIVAASLPLGPDYSVLEIGAGAGALTLAVLAASPAARVTATDVSPRSLELLKDRAAHYTNLQCEVQDGVALNYEDASFDAVIGNSILHHLSPEGCLDELLRVLRPGGSLLFFEPNQMNPQVAFEKTLGRLLMADAIQVSPTERTFARWTYARYLRNSGFCCVRVKPFDFLHPSTPRMAIGLVGALGRCVEHVPLLREVSGSLLLQAKRPD
jgi:ubiquinone/menaquinone biosynthesis C-methylase UbiE